MAAEIDINQTIDSVKKRLEESRIVYDRLTERKNKNPEKFKAQGQLDETIARLEAGNRKLEEYEALKETPIAPHEPDAQGWISLANDYPNGSKTADGKYTAGGIAFQT
jgi:hypothetical protein